MLFPNATPAAHRPGFCHTPAQDRLYDLGYPYLVTLVDGHKDDKKPAAAAVSVFKKNHWGAYHVRWPRLVATAFVRAAAVAGDGSYDAPDVAKAASATGDVSADEARSIVHALLARVNRDHFARQAPVVLALEAVAGTDVVLGAIIDELSGMSNQRWDGGLRDDLLPALYAYLSGFLLLRSARVTEQRARLESLYDATVNANASAGEDALRGGLDLALHGNAGAARALAGSHWQYWYYYLMVDATAVHTARLADGAKSEWVPEARIAYLAGAEMFGPFFTPKALRQGKRLPEILADFGMFADERVTALMVDMIGVKGAGDVPAGYFAEHAPTVAPRLERMARGSSATAEKAKAALKLARA